MFTTVYETSAHSRRSSLSSRRSSVTSLSDLTANELAFKECTEVIDAIRSNAEEVITNKADEREKKWWIDGNYKIINEDR